LFCIVDKLAAGLDITGCRTDDGNGPQNGKTYHMWRAYGQSKTANMLFAVSLAEKLGKKGLIAVSLQPGVVKTHLGREMREEDVAAVGSSFPFLSSLIVSILDYLNK